MDPVAWEQDTWARLERERAEEIAATPRPVE